MVVPVSLVQRLLFLVAGLLGRWVIACYYLTVRIRNSPEAQTILNHPVRGIFAFWHSHQLSSVWHLRRRRAAILISASKDGEYIARVAEALGFRPVRGSSSRRGAVGLRELIRIIREGGIVGITPDGPRGPRYTINPGVLALAQKTGAPIQMYAIGLSAFWELRSWDRFRIPKPFARGVFCFGEALTVPPDADESELARLAAILCARMLDLEKKADELATRHG